MPAWLADHTDSLTDLPPLHWNRTGATRGPLFHGADLVVDEPRHAYLDMTGWANGVVWVYGFCLGRFWKIGPQRTLYLPGPVLRAGTNEIVVLDRHPAGNRSIALGPEPLLGPNGQSRPAS